MKAKKLMLMMLLALVIPALASCNKKEKRDYDDDEDTKSSVVRSKVKADVAEEESLPIEGRWSADIDMEDDEIESCIITFDFKGEKDGTFNMTQDIMGTYSEDGVDINMHLLLSCEGGWELDNDDIELSYNRDSLNLSLVDVDIPGVGLGKADKNMMKKAFDQEMKSEMMDEMDDVLDIDVLRSVKIHGNTMNCKIDRQDLTFTRK